MISISRLLGVAVVAALAGSALADDRVLVIPFNNLNVPSDKQWISKAAQENLIADLGRAGGVDPISFGGQVIVEDNATAARLARNVNAAYVIRGAAQVVGDNVRLTAQLIDSGSGDTVRTALVTGTAGDLLKLEDELAAQIRGAQAAAGASAPATPTYIPVPAQAPQVIVISQPEPQPYYPTYYPYYDYGFNYLPVVVFPFNGGHDHDHDHDRDHDHDGHGGPGHGGNGGGLGGGGVQIVHQSFNPAGLPIPTTAGNILPIPTPAGNMLPVLTNNVLPVPHNTVQVVTHVNAPMPSASGSPMSPNNGPAGGPRGSGGQGRSSRQGN